MNVLDSYHLSQTIIIESLKKSLVQSAALYTLFEKKHTNSLASSVTYGQVQVTL